jgi:hypothetical protein
VFRTTDRSTVAKVDSIAKELKVNEAGVGTQMNSDKCVKGAIGPTRDFEDGV